MMRKLRKFTLLLLSMLMCLPGSLAEDAQLNDMSSYAERVQEELGYFQALYAESDGWKTGAVLLDEAEYAWIGEAREVLKRYFADAHALDVSQKAAKIEVYASANLSDGIAGFSDGENHVYINRGEIERVPERMLHILLHEMIHALGVDFYGDASGMLANGFFEGMTEAVTKAALEESGYAYEDFTGYDEVQLYAEPILQADAALISDLLQGNEGDVAKRIDALAGEGSGRILLECELLLSTGPEGEEIGDNCAKIVRRYAENMASRSAKGAR